MADIHTGHRKRTKEEFRKGGFSLENYPSHKILEMLLFYSVPRVDTNSLAHMLIDRFGSLSAVLDAPYEVLCEVDGMSCESATQMKFIVSLFREYMGDISAKENMLSNTEAAKNYVQSRFIGENMECTYLIALGSNGRMLFCNKIAEGSPETVSVSPNDIIRPSIRVNAAKIIIAHNHPNGICIPSSTDVRTTAILRNETAKVNIELIDHIIAAPDGVCSMREQGML